MNRASPLWRLWLEWQKKSLVEFDHLVQDWARRINPNLVRMHYSTAIYHPGVNNFDIQQFARVAFVGTEGTNVTFPAYARLFSQQRILSTYARRYGRPSWPLYKAGGEIGPWAAWLAALTCSGPKVSSGISMSPILKWPYWAEARRWAEPVADVAVLLSAATRDGSYPTAALHCAEVHGWCQVFGLEGIQFNPVAGLFTTPEELASYAAVVVPHCESMPTDLVEIVHEYVKQGGVALVTGVPGRYDRLGFPLGKDSLLQRMGMYAIVPASRITYDISRQQYGGRTDQTLSLASEFMSGYTRKIAMLQGYRFDPVFLPGTGYVVLARFADGKPAVCSVEHGKGRYIYLGFLPGAMNYQERLHASSVWQFHIQPQVARFVRNLSLEATGRCDRIVVEGEGILSCAYRKGEKAWVRLLNILGTRDLQEGGRLGYGRQPSYPDLGAITLRIRMPLHGTPVLLTPDRNASLSLSAVQEDFGSVVEIPAGAFQRFAFVRMRVEK